METRWRTIERLMVSNDLDSQDLEDFIASKKDEYANLRDITKVQYRREISMINEKERIIWIQEKYLKELRDANENDVVEDEKGMEEEEISGDDFSDWESLLNI